MSRDLPEYLSDDQKQAMETVMDCVDKQRVTTLSGPAGSGKSTLTKEIIELSERHVVLGAPTGKASVVLREKSGFPAATIHGLLYGGAFYDKDTKRLIFTRPDAPCTDHDLLMLDEGSMIGRKLWVELMEHVPGGARVLVIGDKYQLPPVNETWGPELDGADAHLTKVHRQAEQSQIIQYATAIREGRGERWQAESYDDSDPNFQVYGDIDSAVEWLVDARQKDEDATLITYTHKIRSQINQAVRERLGLFDPKVPFVTGDKLVVRSNNHSIGLMNGEVVTVVDSEEVGPGKYTLILEERQDFELLTLLSHLEQPADVFQSWKSGNGRKLPKELRDLYLHVHYGQCLTVHSSQGGQWKKSGFLMDAAYRRMSREDSAMGRRFLYTAITRAAENLAVFVL